ncbi:MAG: nitrous oxide reductase accessory protein NosL [Pedobacter sp.]|jgi:copper chaperone NosL
MSNNKVPNLTRIILLVCGLALIIVLFTPIWRIDLSAPQYPEGLFLLIYADKLAGNVDIINGLNHYIGMKTLHTDDFIEFKALPIIIPVFAGLFVLVAAVASRLMMRILLFLFVTFGILAMVDFWKWEYDYGHNLDPNAAIIVPGMAYQPPLIGFKQLLNFGAYSFPDIGGWIFISVGVALLAVVVLDWKKVKKNNQGAAIKLLIFGLISIGLSSCSTEPEPIRIGKDNCQFCKMTISDKRFGAEIVTKKSKIFKFDDQHCLISYMKADGFDSENVAGVYFTDFNEPHSLIPVEKAHFLQSPDLNSPMNGDIAAFSHEDSLGKALPRYYGNRITWEEMLK